MRVRPAGIVAPAMQLRCVAGATESRVELNERRRARAENRDSGQRARDSARAALAMALKRGTLTRGWCVVCADRNVIGYQPNSRRPLAVTWVCRRDRPELIERLNAERERVAWNERRARCERELPLLPLAVQTAIGDGSRDWACRLNACRRVPAVRDKSRTDLRTSQRRVSHRRRERVARPDRGPI
jgi:hypothetical protein